MLRLTKKMRQEREWRVEEAERNRPLLEKIKDIFRKYGMMVTAILLAAGIIIGTVVGAITKALKTTGGSKIASMLPGLIGSIVSSFSKPLVKPSVFWPNTPGFLF